MTKDYKQALEDVFGDDWKTGHEAVKKLANLG